MNPSPAHDRLIQTAEEVVAASVCFLARFRGLGTEIRGVAGAGERLHIPPCRFCSVPEKELAALVAAWNQTHDLRAAQITLDNLPPKTRWARIHEAQRLLWNDELPEAAV